MSTAVGCDVFCVFFITKDPIDGFLDSEEGKKLGGGLFSLRLWLIPSYPEFSRTQNRSFSNQYLPKGSERVILRTQKSSFTSLLEDPMILRVDASVWKTCVFLFCVLFLQMCFSKWDIRHQLQIDRLAPLASWLVAFVLLVVAGREHLLSRETPAFVLYFYEAKIGFVPKTPKK